jgi:multidrug transporter EmrE-like cation transporter
MSQLVAYTIALALGETIAMTALTKYSKSYNINYLIAGIALYGILIPYMIISSLNFSGIGTVNLLWNIITTVSMIVIGYYLFNEKVNHLHIVSLLLGIGSIVILYFADDK